MPDKAKLGLILLNREFPKSEVLEMLSPSPAAEASPENLLETSILVPPETTESQALGYDPAVCVITSPPKWLLRLAWVLNIDPFF